MANQLQLMRVRESPRKGNYIFVSYDFFMFSLNTITLYGKLNLYLFYFGRPNEPNACLFGEQRCKHTGTIWSYLRKIYSIEILQQSIKFNCISTGFQAPVKCLRRPLITMQWGWLTGLYERALGGCLSALYLNTATE